MPRPTFYTRSISKAKSSSVAPPLALLRPSEENKLPSSPPIIVPNHKESRAWEHDRQRLKKTADLVKTKARKAQGWAPSRGIDPKTGLDTLDDDRAVLEASEHDLDEVVPAPALGTTTTHLDYALSAPRTEVQLADLLISKKPRHGRGMYISSTYRVFCGAHADAIANYTAGDFEVIPHIRSVIVLDDNMTPDLDFDEPWEHIYATEDDEHTSHEPSYATIASLN